MSDEILINKAYRIPWSEYQRNSVEHPDPFGASLHLTLKDAEEYLSDFKSQISENHHSFIEPDLHPKRDTIPIVDVGPMDMKKLVEYGSTWQTGK